MRKCLACGEWNSDDSTTCKSCATPLSVNTTESPKQPLTKRALFIVGLRLIGIYLMIFGFLGALHKMGTNYVMLRLVARTINLGLDEFAGAFIESMQYLSITTGVIWDLIRIVVGLYLCRGGKLIIKFVGMKDEVPIG